MRRLGVFVTGTDTGIGKTYVASVLIEMFRSAGLRVAAMKPVATGAFLSEEGWVHEDAQKLRATAGLDVPYAWVNPYLFRMPASPHIAARAEGVAVDFEDLEVALDRLGALADCVVVEGIGGWRVPVNEHQDVADLALKFTLPVVLVVGLRLGCINHARLTAEAIRQSGAVMGGWIANELAPPSTVSEDMLFALESMLGRPLLKVPFGRDQDDHALAPNHRADMVEILRLVTP